MKLFPNIARLFGLCLLSCLPLSVWALGTVPYVKSTAGAGDFLLVAPGRQASLWVDEQDYPGVKRAAADLQRDIARVSSKTLSLVSEPDGVPLVIMGTLGHSRLIDQLVAEHKLDVSAIYQQWDAYRLVLVQNPLPKVPQALVIVGSNKRGTSYGIYDLSEQIGVSPWYWWADVPVAHKAALYIDKKIAVTEIPVVKYRGIFLNDEAPALTGWVQQHYGNYNHEFYAKLFDLLLRLRANYLWPAMWNNAFSADDPLNMQLADDYGIIMGTSHHEPMMRAHKEWSAGMGPWDYSRNKEALAEFWKGGIERNKPYENLITIGMRGDGDEPMSEKENVSLLETIVQDQRELIAQVYQKPAAQVPQVWALYKEVQGYYERGMRVPDDVTLLWCDDNWGNIRRLPTAEERKRAGGAGIYYHFDYVGGPRSYRWINTNNIANVWEQMNLAYHYDATRIWLVNVGDLKPMEFPTEFFLRMAWNPEQWPRERLPEFTRLWAAREFGPEHAREIADLVNGYTQHNAIRKPELQDENTYSQLYDREAERVLAHMKDLADKANALANKLPAAYRDAYFELVQHPVNAGAIITELYDAQAKNHLYAQQGRVSANRYAQQVRDLFAQDAALQKRWDTELAQGHWAHFMDQSHIGYTHWNNPPANQMPLLYDYTPVAAADMGVAIEGSASAWPHESKYQLPRFDPYGQSARWIDIFNRGTKTFKAHVTASAPWIQLSQQGDINIDEVVRLHVSIDWKKMSPGDAQGYVDIVGTGYGSARINVAALKPAVQPDKHFQGAIEADGVVALSAGKTQTRVAAADLHWGDIPGHGLYGNSISVFPTRDFHLDTVAGAPYVEYHFFNYSNDSIHAIALLAPSWPFLPGHSLHYAIAIDNESPQIVDYVQDQSQAAWEASVINNIRSATTLHKGVTPGAHKLRFYALDSGVTLERLVLDLGGLKPSYLGPVDSPQQ